MFWLPFIDLFWDSFKWIFSKIKMHRREKNRESKGFLSAAGTYLSGIRSDTEQWFVSTFGITPHLERYIELPERIRVISEKKFRPYRHNTYGRVSYIRVSEDDKWVKILGKYFPLDLICGYNNETNELFFIDGYVVKLPPKAMTGRLNKCIEDFFDEMKILPKDITEIIHLVDIDGAYIPDELKPAFEEITKAYQTICHSSQFINELRIIRKEFQGRPTPVYHCERLLT